MVWSLLSALPERFTPQMWHLPLRWTPSNPDASLQQFFGMLVNRQRAMCQSWVPGRFAFGGETNRLALS